MPQPSPNPVPEWIGKYRILGPLRSGKGYKALDDAAQAVVTLVVLPPGLLGPPAALQMTAAAALGVAEEDVRVIASGEIAGAAYIAVEPIAPDAPRRRKEEVGAPPRAIRGIGAAWAGARRRPGTVGAAGAILLVAGLAGFCGGGPSRLAGAGAYKDLTVRLDALYEAQAAPLSAAATRYNTPGLAAALRAFERIEPGDESVAALQRVRAEIDAVPIEGEAVCILDRQGEVVEVRGDGPAAEALHAAWRASTVRERVIAVCLVPWIGSIVPIRTPDAARSIAGWAIVGNPLDLAVARDAAADSEAVVVWRVNDATYRLGPGEEDVRTTDLLDPIGERAIPGGMESAHFHSIFRSPIRATSLAVAFLGMILLVLALRFRGART